MVCVALVAALVAAVPAAAGAQTKPKTPAKAPQPLPEPKLPVSYLLTPTDQLGFPGQKPGTLVTPEGDLYTGWAEVTFNVGGLETFEPRSHTLEGGRYPVVHLFKVVRGVLYELDTFQTSVGGRPTVFARITMRNLLPRFNHARVAAGVRYDGSEFGPRSRSCCVRIYRFPRPRTPERDGLYDQPGVGFNAASVYGLAPFTGGSMLTRDGQVLLLYPGASPGIGVNQSLAPDPPPVNTKTQFGRTIYDVALRARERKSLVFRMPVETLAPTDPALGALASARFEQYRAITKRSWRSLLGGAMSVGLPERKVVDTFYSSIVQDALSRYQLPSGLWVQAVNKLRYHSFYLRDGSVIGTCTTWSGCTVSPPRTSSTSSPGSSRTACSSRARRSTTASARHSSPSATTTAGPAMRPSPDACSPRSSAPSSGSSASAPPSDRADAAQRQPPGQ